MKIYKIIKIFSDQATSPIRRGGIRTMSQFFVKQVVWKKAEIIYGTD